MLTQRSIGSGALRRVGRVLAGAILATALLALGCVAETGPGPEGPDLAAHAWSAAAGGAAKSAKGGWTPMASSLDMGATMTAAFTATECQNSPGPFITLEGEMSLAGLGLRLIFRNNLRGTHEHTEDMSVDVVILPAGASITIPKQPPLGGAGGNPFIWIQLLDAEGQPLTGEVFLGRCVQGLSPVALDHLVPAEALLRSVVADCHNNPGPFITVEGGAVISGVTALLIFRNNDNPVGGPHEASAETTVQVEVMPELPLTFPKQPVLGGAGGNPWIFAQYIDGDGNPLGEELLIGRCVQLQPGN